MPSLRLPSAAFMLAVIVASGLSACHGDAPAAPSGGNGSSNGGSSSGGSGGGSAATGTLTIRLTDSPFSEAQALLVTFTDVSVHRADPGEWRTVSNAPRTCDLKKLNGPVDVLGVASLPAGKYTQIRLNVSTAAIYFDAPSTGPACAPSITPPGGAFEPVTIPSGEIKLNNEFTLAGAGTTITLDFDGDQSVRQTGGGNGRGNSGGTSSGKYMMSPVIRVVSVQ